jgi:seryl-tRNA synthetase
VNFTLRLPTPLPVSLAADVEKQGVYASPLVQSLRVSADRSSVEVEFAGGTEDDVRPKIERYMAAMTSRFREQPTRVVSQNSRSDRAPLGHDVYGELKRRGFVLELGRGQVGLCGPALALYETVDRHVARVARTEFGAVAQSYPALIPAQVLGRCGYFASFPHALSMVIHCVEDYDLIEEFRRAHLDPARALHVPRPEMVSPPGDCLVPAVCYHCYQALEDQALIDERTYTALGSAFRYESKNIHGLDRLWDFHMREIIFVGTEAHVTRNRARALDLLLEHIREWDLEGSIESANDPFFPELYAQKTYYQMRADLKYELRLAIEPDKTGAPRTLAAASANLHENFFGRTFRFTGRDGQPGFTGCAGWGLERWVLAGFTQHGFDPARWPAALRQDVFA